MVENRYLDKIKICRYDGWEYYLGDICYTEWGTYEFEAEHARKDADNGVTSHNADDLLYIVYMTKVINAAQKEWSKHIASSK